MFVYSYEWQFLWKKSDKVQFGISDCGWLGSLVLGLRSGFRVSVRVRRSCRVLRI